MQSVLGSGVFNSDGTFLFPHHMQPFLNNPRNQAKCGNSIVQWPVRISAVTEYPISTSLHGIQEILSAL
jgi:hypothetical protein